MPVGWKSSGLCRRTTPNAWQERRRTIAGYCCVAVQWFRPLDPLAWQGPAGSLPRPAGLLAVIRAISSRFRTSPETVLGASCAGRRVMRAAAIACFRNRRLRDRDSGGRPDGFLPGGAARRPRPIQDGRGLHFTRPKAEPVILEQGDWPKLLRLRDRIADDCGLCHAQTGPCPDGFP
jgi:hypothetical protein